MVYQIWWLPRMQFYKKTINQRNWLPRISLGKKMVYQIYGLPNIRLTKYMVYQGYSFLRKRFTKDTKMIYQADWYDLPSWLIWFTKLIGAVLMQGIGWGIIWEFWIWMYSSCQKCYSNGVLSALKALILKSKWTQEKSTKCEVVKDIVV